MKTHEEFLAERKTGLGSTDSAAVMGVSPWKSAHDVWRSKVLDEPPKEPSLPMWLGTRLEGAVAELYTAATAQVVARDESFYAHPARPIMKAHIDYRWAGPDQGPLVQELGSAPIVECKTARSKKGWGDVGTDKIPRHYWIQVQHQMACLPNVPFVDVAVLFGHDDFRIYRIARNQAFIDSLVEDMAEWWELYVVPQVPPPVDGSEAAGRMLREKYPTSTEDMLPATADHRVLVEELTIVRETKAALERSEELLKQKLMDAIGLHAGMYGGDFTITWKENKSVKKVEWPAVVHDLEIAMNDKGMPGQTLTMQSIASHTTIKPGARPFILTLEEQND